MLFLYSLLTPPLITTQHETRRHALLHSSTLARLVKLQTDHAQTRLTILNPSSSFPSSSFPSIKSNSSTPHNAKELESEILAARSEVHLLDTALAESHASRLELERENKDWREVVRHVGEFVESMSEIRGFATSETAALVSVCLSSPSPFPSLVSLH